MILTQIGGTYFKKKQYEQVIEFHQQALLIAREIPNNKQGEINNLLIIASNYILLNKGEQALKFYQEALPLARAIPNNESQEADILQGIATAYSKQDNIDSEIDFLYQSLAIRRKIKNEAAQLESLILLGNAYQLKASNYEVKGLYSQAKREFASLIKVGQEALALARKLQKPKSEADALSWLGYTYSFLKDNQKAIEFLQQAVSIGRKINDLDSEKSALGHLAGIYIDLGEGRKVIEIRLRQVEIARLQNNKFFEASNLDSLGTVYNAIGEHEKAIETYQQALITAKQIEIGKLGITRDYALETELSILSDLSRAYSNLGEYDKATEVAQQVLMRSQTLHKPELEAKALLSLADSYNHLENASKAIEVSQRALTIARQIKAPKLEAEALQSLSSGYKQQGNYTLALESAEKSLAIAKPLENPLLEQDALNALQHIYFKQGNYPKALEFAQQILALVQKTKINNFEVGALNSLSFNYLMVGDTTNAMEIAKQALALARQQQNPSDEAVALNALSNAYRVRGDYEQGVETAQTSLNISRKNRTFIGEVAAAVNLSVMYEALGEYKKVIAVAEPGLQQARKIKSYEKEAELLVNLANAYIQLGEHSKARDFIEQGLKIARQQKNPRLESIALNSFGYYYASLGDYKKALELSQESLKIAQDLKSLPLLVSPQFNLGDIYSKLGNYNKAREFYQQALTTSQQLKNRQNEGIALFAQGYTYFAQGEPQKTVELSQKALNIFQEIKVPRLEAFATTSLSVGYGELGDDVKAMSAAQSFLTFTRKTQNSVWEKSALFLLASLHSKFGRKDQAIATYLQAIAIKTEPDTDAYNYAGLARIYRDLNQPSVAIKYYKESINRIQQFRHNIEGLPPELQNSFLDSTVDLNHTKVSDIYRQLADLLLSQGREKEAFQVRLLIQNQELREATGYRSSTDKPNIPLTPNDAKIPTQSPSIIALARQIDECKRTNCPQSSELEERKIVAIKEFTKNLGAIDQQIRSNRANDDGFFDPKELGKAQNIVEAEPNTVMIYPLVLEKEMWVQLYGAKGVVKTLKITVSREELGKTVKEFRDLMEHCQKTICGVDETAKVKVVSQKLYNWLIKDLEPELQNNQVKNLVFALDRETRYIPMSALYDGKQYLIEKYSIHNVLNQDYDKNARLPVGIENTQILAMGLSNAVSKPSMNFRALSNVPAELDAIVKTNNNQGIYPGQKYLNGAFDLSKLQHNLEGHKILHLATHGVFDSKNPKESFILLGNGNELKPDDITTLTGLSDINLVVLSACQTALGDRQEQDGIEINTLAFYFINRGAKSVMASLWVVADDSTSTLIQQFYRNLAKATKQTPITKAEALRQAQITLLRSQSVTAGDAPRRSPEGSWVNPTGSNTPTRKDIVRDLSHPYYWAPFILLGNGL